MSGRDQMSDQTAELHVPSENTRLVQNGVIHVGSSSWEVSQSKFQCVSLWSCAPGVDMLGATLNLCETCGHIPVHAVCCISVGHHQEFVINSRPHPSMST